jgi:sigma-B regulation protein RsbU (phosphoserine phosphatase)
MTVTTDDGGLVLAVADVAWKGARGAAVFHAPGPPGTQASIASVRRSCATSTSVYRGTAIDQFATFFIARIRPDWRMLFSNAGHNYPIVARRDGAQVMLERGGLVLGVMESAEYEEDAIHLETGDRVVLYTDGITEAVNPEGELYGEERLQAVISDLPSDLTAREVTDRILGELEVYRNGVEPKDDITLMVVRVLEPDPARIGSGQRQLVETRV